MGTSLKIHLAERDIHSHEYLLVDQIVRHSSAVFWPTWSKKSQSFYNISLGRLVKCLRSVVTFGDHTVANLLPSVSVKEFWKSINIDEVITKPYFLTTLYNVAIAGQCKTIDINVAALAVGLYTCTSSSQFLHQLATTWSQLEMPSTELMAGSDLQWQ